MTVLLAQAPDVGAHVRPHVAARARPSLTDGKSPVRAKSATVLGGSRSRRATSSPLRISGSSAERTRQSLANRVGVLPPDAVMVHVVLLAKVLPRNIYPRILRTLQVVARPAAALDRILRVDKGRSALSNDEVSEVGVAMAKPQFVDLLQ